MRGEGEQRVLILEATQHSRHGQSLSGSWREAGREGVPPPQGHRHLGMLRPLRLAGPGRRVGDLLQTVCREDQRPNQVRNVAHDVEAEPEFRLRFNRRGRSLEAAVGSTLL